MKKPKVIKMSNLPARLPFVGTIAWWLLLDRLNVPEVAWGVFYTLEVILWATCIGALLLQDSVDLFEGRAK